MPGWKNSTQQRQGVRTLREPTRLNPVERTFGYIPSSALELKCYRNPALSFSATSNNRNGNSSTSKNKGDLQRQMLAMLYTKDNDILQTHTILQWCISLGFLSDRTPAAGSKYLLDLYQSMCHIYKVIFSLALGRKANAASDFCLQGLKSFTLDSCYPPPLTQDLSCTEECLFICCCCTATKRGRAGEAAWLGILMRVIELGNRQEYRNYFLKIYAGS